ncbi:MAG: hypothetical protein NT123_22375 [Proteobacteria bacterium]|nr:hypothetical protein [Pseudomonadota bacterium]
MSINTYIEEEFRRFPEGFGDYGPDFERLLSRRGGTTIDAMELWKEIASGDADVVQTLYWVQCVAERICKDVVGKSGRGRDAAPAALKAIGFYGPPESERRAKECMRMISDFDVLDESGNWVSQRRLTGSEWLKFLRSEGHLKKMKDKTAINKINQWREEYGIDK